MTLRWRPPSMPSPLTRIATSSPASIGGAAPTRGSPAPTAWFQCGIGVSVPFKTAARPGAGMGV